MTRRQTVRNVAAFAFVVCVPLHGGAQQGMSRAEAAQSYTATGVAITNGRPVSRCGQPAKRRVTFVDPNADRRPEALIVTVHIPVGDSGCTPNVGVTGRADAPAGGCADEALAAALPAASTRPKATEPRADAAPPAAATLQAGDEAAVFKAAGFKRRGDSWRSDCDDPGTAGYSPGRIDQVADLNGDGLPDVVLSEGGTFCHGDTGQGFWLLARQADGRWKLMTQGTGIAQFLKTKGAQGWPDISVGGPGFCFPVERWDGREYKLQRWEYEGKACKPPR